MSWRERERSWMIPLTFKHCLHSIFIISHPSAVGNWHAILLSLTLFGQQQPKTASKNINKQKLVYYTLVWTQCLMHRCVYLMVHITKLQQKKYSQTLKKGHQITHMKIICTAVEETHNIKRYIVLILSPIYSFIN